MTEIIKREINDHVAYSRYGGDHKNIYPSRSNGSMHRMGRRSLMTELAANSILKSEALMIDNAVSEIAETARARVESEAKRLVP
jgi:hypothetical protein